MTFICHSIFCMCVSFPLTITVYSKKTLLFTLLEKGKRWNFNRKICSLCSTFYLLFSLLVFLCLISLSILCTFLDILFSLSLSREVAWWATLAAAAWPKSINRWKCTRNPRVPMLMACHINRIKWFLMSKLKIYATQVEKKRGGVPKKYASLFFVFKFFT